MLLDGIASRQASIEGRQLTHIHTHIKKENGSLSCPVAICLTARISSSKTTVLSGLALRNSSCYFLLSLVFLFDSFFSSPSHVVSFRCLVASTDTHTCAHHARFAAFADERVSKNLGEFRGSERQMASLLAQRTDALF